MEMDYLRAVALRASVESVTILTGIVLGEIVHRLLTFSSKNDFQRNQMPVTQRRTSRKRRRNPANDSGGGLARFEKLFWKKFDLKIIYAAVLLSVAYCAIVGFEKVNSLNCFFFSAFLAFDLTRVV